jgi:hypothetical protein
MRVFTSSLHFIPPCSFGSVESVVCFADQIGHRIDLGVEGGHADVDAVPDPDLVADDEKWPQSGAQSVPPDR